MSEQVTGPRDPEENAEDRDLQKSEVSIADDAVDAGIAADGWHPESLFAIVSIAIAVER